LRLLIETHVAFLLIAETTYQICWQGGVVGIATGYGLDGPGIESRWGTRFSHLSRPAKSGRGVTLTHHSF
jgi:hypothetical protein